MLNQAKLGEGTNTLDNDPTNSEVIATAAWDHVTIELLQASEERETYASLIASPRVHACSCGASANASTFSVC